MNYWALKSFCKHEPSLLILYFALSPLAELFPGVIVITRWRTSPNASDTSEIFCSHFNRLLGLLKMKVSSREECLSSLKPH